MIARPLVLAMCAGVSLMANAQEQKPAEDKKLTTAQQAIEDVRKQLLKTRMEVKAPEEELRIDLALFALSALPKDVVFVRFEKSAGFDDGLLHYEVTSVTQQNEGFLVAFTVLNSGERPAAIPDVAARLKNCGLYSDFETNKLYEGAELTMHGKGGLPPNGKVIFTRLYRGKPGNYTQVGMDFYGSKHQFARIIVPANKVTR